jgi:hypothetical protein
VSLWLKILDSSATHYLAVKRIAKNEKQKTNTTILSGMHHRSASLNDTKFPLCQYPFDNF